jgi:PQQ-like domain
MSHRRIHPSLAILLGATSLASLALGGGCGGSSSPGGTGGQATSTSSTSTSEGGAGGSSSTSTGTAGGGGIGGSAPMCASGAWITYGHDARRTSTSPGCVKGPLTTAWRYVPAPPMGKKVNAVFCAIAQSDAAFLQWSAENGMYLGTTAADRVDTSGKRVWTFDNGTDSNVGNWPSIAFESLVLNDDGIYYLDLATGMKTQGTGVDYWGQTVEDGGRLYAVNSSHVDGPGIFVGAFDAQAKQLWAANQYGMCRIDASDIANGIAADQGTLFYAASYSPGMGVMLPFASGLYAFEGATGNQKWTQPTTPTSAVSAGGGLVYLSEQGTLVARKQSDGSIAWMGSAKGTGSQAPVIVGSLVIVATDTGVSAFDAQKGDSKWTAMIPGAAAHAFALGFSGGCVPGSSMWSANSFGTAVHTTSLAAAGGNNTLVVTAPDGVHLLSIADGSEQWKGMPAMAMGALGDPVIVDGVVYVMDQGGLLQLKGM